MNNSISCEYPTTATTTCPSPAAWSLLDPPASLTLACEDHAKDHRGEKRPISCACQLAGNGHHPDASCGEPPVRRVPVTGEPMCESCFQLDLFLSKEALERASRP